MGSVTVDTGTRSHALRVTAPVVALLAWALFVAGPAHANTDAPDGEGQAGQFEHELGEEEEPQALEHVMDSTHIELFSSLKGKKLFGTIPLDVVHIPALFEYHLGGKEYQFPTKYSLLELVAALLVAAIFIPVARRLRTGAPAKGGFLNAFEVLLTFVRDDVAKPSIGHDADRYVPFLWTMFLFILFNNLLGLIPFCGSATGNIFVTFGLALCVFFAIHGSAIRKMGFGPYVASMWPHIDVPFPLNLIIVPVVFVIEVVGVLVRNLVLAVRLFANMFAGHVVLATILIFIYVAGSLHPGLWGTITFLSVVGQVTLSLLELFVAFLQAYIFTFLTALFMGMALHPAH